MDGLGSGYQNTFRHIQVPSPLPPLFRRLSGRTLIMRKQPKTEKLETWGSGSDQSPVIQ